MPKKKLKIALFHLAFIYSGGGEKLVLQEYDGLKARGHNVDIYTTVSDRKKSFPEIIGKYRIKTFLPQFSVFRGHEAFQTILSCLLVPFYAVRFKDYDVILACNQPSPWIAFLINKIFGVPYVSYLAQPTRFLHQRRIDKKTGLFFSKKASESLSAKLMMNTFRGFSDWADRVSIKNSFSVLVNGTYSQKMIEKVYKVRTVLCPSGVAITEKPAVKKGGYLLVTNRHFAQKKIEYAIFALNYIRSLFPDIRLIVTGSDSEYTLLLKSLSKELGMQDRVEFSGYVTEEKLKRLYKNAAVYLYTAPEEDFGMGIIEAMSFGIPTVAWDNAGPSKIIKNGVTGYLAKPYDLNDFSGLIAGILKNRKLASKIGKNAREFIIKEYSDKNHISRLEAELILAQKHS